MNRCRYHRASGACQAVNPGPNLSILPVAINGATTWKGKSWKESTYCTAPGEHVGWEPELPDYMFTVWLQGIGSTEEEAWEDANAALFLEPGEAECVQRVSGCERHPQDTQWPAPSLVREDLCCTPLMEGRSFLYWFKVHLYGTGANEDKAWGEVSEELLSSRGGVELNGLEEIVLLHQAQSDASQLDLFAVGD